MRVAIIGGGISGLTTAFYLEQERRRTAPVSFVLFEAEPRFGGVIRTERADGCVIEAGPDSFLASKPWARELCDDLRLSSQLIGSRDNDRKAYILIDGHLEPLPPGMQMMVPTKLIPVLTSKLFSTRAKLAMLREYLHPPQPLAADEDESVSCFVERHFTSEVVERIADPLLAGVYGGDCNVLSARATLPQMVDSEARHHSLIRGALAARTIHKKGEAPQPLFTAMKDGMQRIVEALVRQVPRETLRCSSPVDALQKRESGWQISAGGTTEEFDQVVLSLPTHVAARLIADVPNAQRVVEILNEFSYTSAVTVTLGYKASDIVLPSGFGFLVPRGGNKRTMACTFVHNKFENRAPDDMALLRVFLGGARNPEMVDKSEGEIAEIVRADLQDILKVNAEPRFVRVFKWPKSMAQYEVGHLLRIARLEMHIQRFSGLHLTGNAYHGIGIPDCVRAGRSAADAIMRRIHAQRASS